MADLWMPGAERRQRNHGGAMSGGPARAVHHITYDALRGDGRPAISYDGVSDYLLSKVYDPHLCIDPLTGRIIQFRPANESAAALKHPAGTAPTNGMGTVCLQVEWYFTPGVVRDGKRYATLLDTPLRGLAEFVAWAESWGVPRSVPLAPHDRSPLVWSRQGGHYGHYNVPNNDHTDPVVAVSDLLARVGKPTEEDDLTPDQDKRLTTLEQKVNDLWTAFVGDAGSPQGQRVHGGLSGFIHDTVVAAVRDAQK